MALRISGGTARGLQLRVPQGHRIRPTTERVRSALFSMLQPLPLDQARVLDLFAGTGALGIEALSRGAPWADFVEQDPFQCMLLRENLRLAGFDQRSRVYRGRVERLLGVLSPPAPYTLVLLDPPYDYPEAAAVMARLGRKEAPLSDHAVVCLEHSAQRAAEPQYERLRLWKSRRHGDTGIALYTEGEPPW